MFYHRYKLRVGDIGKKNLNTFYQLTNLPSLYGGEIRKEGTKFNTFYPQNSAGDSILKHLYKDMTMLGKHMDIIFIL